ncbi:MAG: hypothetical protein GX913_01190 [Clostridiales bacterium]|nr:hypothetical protein [Clostridiales bacterium]
MRRYLRLDISKEHGILMVYFIGLILGTLFFNLCNSAYIEEMGIFKNSFIDKLNSLDFSSGELFQYILPKRFKTFFILWGLQITVLGLPVLISYSGYYGFSSGLLVSAFSMGYGFKGIFYFLSLLFPHYLVYLFIWLLIIRKRGSFRNKSDLLEFSFSFFLLFILLIIGVFAESFLNTSILKTLLKNII